MPNGDYLPECFYCAHCIRWEDLRPCNKHDFVMPRGDADYQICRDWQLHPKNHGDEFHFGYVPKFLKRQEFQSLKPGFLYSGNYLKYEVFGSFESLQYLILQINIHKDDELGWCIYVGDLNRKFVPDLGTLVTLNLDGIEHQFKVIDAQRTRESGGGRTGPAGEWEIHYSTRLERIIYCPSSPQALYDWLDKYIDVEAMITDSRTTIHGQMWGEITLNYGISAYIEIQTDNTGSMRPKRLPDRQKEFSRV